MAASPWAGDVARHRGLGARRGGPGTTACRRAGSAAGCVRGAGARRAGAALWSRLSRLSGPSLLREGSRLGYSRSRGPRSAVARRPALRRSALGSRPQPCDLKYLVCTFFAQAYSHSSLGLFISSSSRSSGRATPVHPDPIRRSRPPRAPRRRTTRRAARRAAQVQLFVYRRPRAPNT